MEEQRKRNDNNWMRHSRGKIEEKAKKRNKRSDSEIEEKVKVTLIKSPIGCLPKHRATVRALGLRRCQQSRIHADSSALRGMLRQVGYLLRIENA